MEMGPQITVSEGTDVAMAEFEKVNRLRELRGQQSLCLGELSELKQKDSKDEVYQRFEMILRLVFFLEVNFVPGFPCVTGCRGLIEGSSRRNGRRGILLVWNADVCAPRLSDVCILCGCNRKHIYAQNFLRLE